MNQSKDEQVKNFWRFHRSAEDASRALNLPLEKVKEVYEALTAAQNYREALLKTITHQLKVLVVLLLSAWALPRAVTAQTVAPVITEVAAKPDRSFSGTFQIRNDGVVPLTAIVEKPQTLIWKDGRPNLNPLAPTTHLELSEMSARIGARQSHEFAWRLRCEMLPCATTLYVVITGKHTDSGMQIALHLPTTVYACKKAKGCRALIIAGGRS